MSMDIAFVPAFLETLGITVLVAVLANTSLIYREVSTISSTGGKQLATRRLATRAFQILAFTFPLSILLTATFLKYGRNIDPDSLLLLFLPILTVTFQIAASIRSLKVIDKAISIHTQSHSVGRVMVGITRDVIGIFALSAIIAAGLTLIFLVLII